MKNFKKRWTVQKLFHSWRVCVFCQIVIAVSAVTKSLCRSGSFRILYWFHSETAENKNVLEYSSMWLYQWRNVLIFHERWWKFGQWHLKYIFGGAGEFEKKMSSKCFHQIQSRSKPCTEVILRYLSIKGPSKHLCTRWYKDGKVLNNSPRKQHWGTIVPEDNTNKENNIYVSVLVIPLLRQLIK